MGNVVRALDMDVGPLRNGRGNISTQGSLRPLGPVKLQLDNLLSWCSPCRDGSLCRTSTLLELRDVVVMKLVFTKSSPLNTVLVDKSSGQVVYEIETERRFLSKTTVIRKPFTSAILFFCLVAPSPSAADLE